MKIAVWHNMKSGGGNRSLQQHLRGLLARGHQIEVWSTPEADNSFKDIPHQVKTHIVPWTTAIRIRERYKDNVRAVFFRKDQAILNMEAHCRACTEMIENGDFDLLYVHSCNQFLMPYVGKFVKKIPSVLYLHEPNRSLLEAWYDKLVWEAPAESRQYETLKNDFFEERRKRVWLREERANYFGYTKVLVNSYFSNESLMRGYGQRGQICYLGIDEGDFPFTNQPRANFVLGLGTFYPHKDIETAVRAIGSITADKRPKLVWVGNDGGGVYFDQMCQLARDLGVVLETHRAISQLQLVQFLNTAKCMIYTSRLEPFGYAPLEANACGLPVVAVAEGGVRETVMSGYNGLLCQRDPAELGRAIGQILGDDALLQQLSANGREWVQQRWAFAGSIDRIEAVLLATKKCFDEQT